MGYALQKAQSNGTTIWWWRQVTRSQDWWDVALGGTGMWQEISKGTK